MKEEAKRSDDECCGLVFSGRESNVPRKEDKPKPPCRQQKDGDK